jgi:hypothetical protein
MCLVALKIHLSWTSHEALSAFQQYTMERRGEIDIKVGQDVTVARVCGSMQAKPTIR